MPLPTRSVPLPVSERPFSAWNLQNHSAGIQDINFDSVPMGELSTLSLAVNCQINSLINAALARACG
jgi:hypothetical protein